MTEPELEQRFLGLVAVDSGTLILGDPAYCLPDRQRGKPGIDYEAVLAADLTLPATELADGLVLLLSRFGGDGTFPVFGAFDGDELLRATVVFIDPADLDVSDDATD